MATRFSGINRRVGREVALENDYFRSNSEVILEKLGTESWLFISSKYPLLTNVEILNSTYLLEPISRHKNQMGALCSANIQNY